MLAYGALNLTTVASPVGAYVDAPREATRLARDLDEWVDAVEASLEDVFAPSASIKAGQWVRNRRMLTARSIENWHHALLA